MRNFIRTLKIKKMVNKVILIGNAGNDPEVKHLDGGTAVARLNIATTESYKDKNTGERISQTEWHSIVFWRGLAEVVEKYVKKGHKLYIEGRLRNRTWEDKDGNKRYSYEIQADVMNMLTSRNEAESYDNSSKHTKPSSSTPEIEVDNSNDLPF